MWRLLWMWLAGTFGDFTQMHWTPCGMIIARQGWARSTRVLVCSRFYESYCGRFSTGLHAVPGRDISNAMHDRSMSYISSHTSSSDRQVAAATFWGVWQEDTPGGRGEGCIIKVDRCSIFSKHVTVNILQCAHYLAPLRKAVDKCNLARASMRSSATSARPSRTVHDTSPRLRASHSASIVAMTAWTLGVATSSR